MPDFSRRADEPELLDLGVPEEEARRSLADLRFVSRWPGGRRALRAAVFPLVADLSRPRLLDVGCGAADVPAWLREARGGRLEVVGLDLKPAHLRQAPATVHRVAGDVTRLPFAPRSFDVVTASLFLHHFPDDAIPGLLRELFALARRALVVSDLWRSRVAHAFGRAFFPFLFQSPVSVSDGLLSIRRGFTRAELERAFGRAGVPVRVRRLFPAYRLLAVATRDERGPT